MAFKPERHSTSYLPNPMKDRYYVEYEGKPHNWEPSEKLEERERFESSEKTIKEKGNKAFFKRLFKRK